MNEKWSTFSNFCLISKILWWFLYMLIALSAGSIILQIEPTIYEFSLIFSFCCILKKKNLVPLILKYPQIWCFLHYPQELFCLWIFFSQKRGWKFFQKTFVILLISNVSKYFLCSFLYNLLQEFLSFLDFFKDLVDFFLNRVFLNMNFS